MGRLIVGAIDFGTTYSGWAYSFKSDYDRDPTKVSTKHWYSSTGSLVTVKTPTCLLVQPDGKTFHAFGYDAEDEYMQLIESDKHMDYFYFKRFKMMLYDTIWEDHSRSLKLKEENGKELPAMQVFSMSIAFLVDDMMTTVHERLAGVIKDTDVHWVITVPAIWSDQAKQFMREAALEAGIPSDQLTLALEPEAASLYCQYLTVDATVEESVISVFQPGTKYLVLDAGGGTVDISVHEVQSQCTLKEVIPSSGGDWGSIVVDYAFEKFIASLVEKANFDNFIKTEGEDWLLLIREFENKKQQFKRQSYGKKRIVMSFPVSLAEKCEMVSTIEKSQYANSLQYKNGKLRISQEIFEHLFDESIEQITSHVKCLMKDEKMEDVQEILMVGGYSKSALLQSAIKTSFPRIHVVIPEDASKAVLMGAVIFGHNPMAITERILKYSYGIASSVPVQKKEHPKVKCIITEDGVWCDDIFSVFIKKGAAVKAGETQIKRTYKTAHCHQQTMTCTIYASRESSPLYVDDDGCSKIGKIKIDLDEPDESPGREINVLISFGGTEVKIELEDKKTGKKVIGTNVFQFE